MSRPARLIIAYLPFIAIFFAIEYLADRGDLISDIVAADGVLFAASAGLLLGVFILRGMIWHWYLRANGFDLSLARSMAMQFKPVLAKYIPGKVWSIVGIGGMLAHHAQSMRAGLFHVMVFQLIMLASGLIVGGLGVAVILLGEGRDSGMAAALAAFAVLAFAIVYRPVINAMVRFAARRSDGASQTDTRVLHGLLGLSVVQWLLMGLAYLVFFRSLGQDLSWYPVLLQPLANNIGILAGFVPAGLGVREGAMSAYMVHAGMGLDRALVLAVDARLWFLLVEVCVFVIGLIVDARSRPAHERQEISG